MSIGRMTVILKMNIRRRRPYRPWTGAGAGAGGFSADHADCGGSGAGADGCSAAYADLGYV